MSAPKYGRLAKDMPVASTVVKSCRHNKTWLIAGGMIEWCYVCGAYRVMKRIGVNQVCPDTKWTRPSNDPNKNPVENK